MIGKFITVEGLDGSGKTTMIEYIKSYLESFDKRVVITREPGGVDVSEKIRNIILNEKIDAKTECLLFAASRREHILNKIIPEIEKGSIVICDRFLDSSIAYQAYGRGLDLENVKNINSYILENITPDITFYFDVDISVGLSRIKNRKDNNQMDNEKKEFYFNVKKGYDIIAEENKKRIIVINANNDLFTVKKELKEHLDILLYNWRN